jgi:hypothetical protein
MKTIEELTEAIEAGIVVGASTSRGVSVTGEPYVEMGTVEPGGRHWKTFLTAEEALACALANFKEYEAGWRKTHPRSGHEPVLYWRIRPELGKFDGLWKVYMRCLLSNLPELKDQSSGRPAS